MTNEPKQPSNKRILAVLPHPDDIEILCAGTIGRMIGLGWEAHLATMTPGDKGSATMSRAEISSIRRDEAQRGAIAIGAATYRCLEFADLEIVFDNPSRRLLASLIREIDPAIVITTPPFDYMADHNITSELVRDATFNAGCKNYESTGHATDGIPYLYYTDAVGGVDMFGHDTPVSCVIDITDQMAMKTDALICHDSQRAWLQRQHGMDNYIESMRSWSAKRGADIGAAFGEAFVQHRGHPYPSDDILARLLA